MIMQTGEFVALRVGSSSPEGDDCPKTRKFARRSKSGCITCRRRHLRCDEMKPVCERCSKAQIACMYGLKAISSRKLRAETLPKSPSSVYETSQEHMDLQFWLEKGARNMGKWHSSAFHEHLLPQFGQANDSVKYALLALSTCVRQWHIPDPQSRRTAFVRGSHYYSLACERLLAVGTGKASIEAALVTSLALFSFDTFSDRLEQGEIHSNAALSLLKQLKQGLAYNEVSGWRSETRKVGARTVIETADAWFDEISFPTSNEPMDQDTRVSDKTQASRTKLYVPFWLELSHDSGLLAEDSMLLKPDLVQPPYHEWKIVRAAPTDIQECHNYLTSWHSWLLTWVINQPMSSDVLRTNQSLCRQWHTWLFATMRPATTMMLSMQNRALLLDEMFEIKLLEVAGNYDIDELRPRFDRVVNLISSNIRMSEQISNSFDEATPCRTRDYWTRQYLRGWGKAIEYLYRKIEDMEIKEQALALFRLVCDIESIMPLGKEAYAARLERGSHEDVTDSLVFRA